LRGVLWLSAIAGVAGLLALRRALAREARAVDRERAFLAGVTHELRTPLTAIRVLGETLAEGRGEPREYGTLVARESERLEALVERVLTLTRVEQLPRFGPVDPAELLRSAVTLVRPRAQRRTTRIECRVEPALPECRWDGERAAGENSGGRRQSVTPPKASHLSPTQPRLANTIPSYGPPPPPHPRPLPPRPLPPSSGGRLAATSRA
jgi:signal transduction histidine kinase